MKVFRLIGLALVALSCASIQESGSGSPDAWFRRPPAELRQEWQTVSREDIHPVLAEKRESAVALLGSRAAVPAPPELVQELAGAQVNGGPWFVVRGLCAACETGAFTVQQSEGRIFVHHAALAGRQIPLTRWPVVVSLDGEPADVYVTASSAR